MWGLGFNLYFLVYQDNDGTKLYAAGPWNFGDACEIAHKCGFSYPDSRGGPVQPLNCLWYFSGQDICAQSQKPVEQHVCLKCLKISGEDI
jgi:hypothetical protein